MGRPIGSKSKSKNKKRNVLSRRDAEKLIEEYGTTPNRKLLEKYNISRGQLINIRRKYGVMPKSDRGEGNE